MSFVDQAAIETLADYPTPEPFKQDGNTLLACAFLLDIVVDDLTNVAERYEGDDHVAYPLNRAIASLRAEIDRLFTVIDRVLDPADAGITHAPLEAARASFQAAA